MKLEVVHIKKTIVACCGTKELKGKEPLENFSSKGHPRVYIYVEDRAKCPYCGKVFILSK